MSESTHLTGSRGIWRIVLASVLAVTLISAVLVATVLSYRGALAAHRHAAGTIRELSDQHAAEKYLARERESMNEYLVRRSIARAEISANEAGFESSLLKIGIGEPKPTERSLVQRALAANEKLIGIFSANSHLSIADVRVLRALDAHLDTSEKAVLKPLRALRSINDKQTRKVVASADAATRRALLFAIFAGALAIAAGLAFASYAVHLVKKIGSRNERLSELDRMKDDFVASVSHELRTPLTSICGYLELLRQGDAGELNAQQHQFVSIVERNADRLLRLVGDLLFVAQVEAGKIALDLGPTNIELLVRQAVDAARPAAAEKEIEFHLELGGLEELRADRARLGQVLDNLISNALKFTPPGGRVSVSTARNADSMVIEVSDNGMGMSEEDVSQLFERFFRTTSATRQGIQGTGLGLAIVQAIVEAHDGLISVESMPGEGTIFRVELPLERLPLAA